MLTIELYHHGVLGMKWGVRKDDSSGSRMDRLKDSADAVIKNIGARLNPRELSYSVKKIFNRPNETTKALAKATMADLKSNGVLDTSEKMLKNVESVGIQRHKDTKYDNLTDNDISNFKRYTDSARFSRNVNGFLAIGDPKMYAQRAEQLKASLSKNNIDDLTVFRSCNLKFSMNKVSKLSKDIDEKGESQLAKVFDAQAKNYIGKSRSENRVFSTSTSPLFAIDTWRKVNPTAASSYNCYMVINCKKTPGILADATTRSGKRLVNTRSNQEAILAPNKLIYRNMKWDKKRKMFALTVDAS